MATTTRTAATRSVEGRPTDRDGNVLTDTKLEVVCEALNQFFTALADGSYTDEFYTTPCNDALISAWDAAVPLPVAVTPEALRIRTTGVRRAPRSGCRCHKTAGRSSRQTPTTPAARVSSMTLFHSTITKPSLPLWRQFCLNKVFTIY